MDILSTVLFFAFVFLIIGMWKKGGIFLLFSLPLFAYVSAAGFAYADKYIGYLSGGFTIVAAALFFMYVVWDI